METRSAKRKKLLNASFGVNNNEGVAVDRISDLPDEIIHHILSKLHITSIAQTSVLSKRWRQLWHSYPDLDFSTIHGQNNSLVGRRVFPWIHRGDESSFINQVFSRRDKHSGIRVLRVRACLTFSCLNSLFRTAIKNNVQELDVEVYTEDYFNFPRSVLMSNSLRVFRLMSLCPGFRLPPPLILKGGFQSLFSLSLSRIILNDQPSLLNLFDDYSFPKLKTLTLEMCIGLKSLNLRCRGIQDLELKSCYDLEELRIDIQKLKNLTVLNCFDTYSDSSSVKIDAPMLETIYWSNISLTHDTVLKNLNSVDQALVGFLTHEEFCQSKIHSLFVFLSGISTCQTLTLESLCIEVLSKNYQFSRLSQPFSRLKSLELRISFKKHNLQGLADLFKNSPYIEKLVIIVADLSVGRKKWNRDLWEMSPSGEERFWESQSEALNSFLHHLRVAKIQGFSECEDEISLVKFLLKHGKVLQEVFLCCSSQLSKSSKDSLRKQKIKSQIMGFSRASSNAQIFFQ